MDNTQANIITKFIASLKGAVIHSEAPNELAFIKDSKNRALQHEWLYHCTNANALCSILKNREFWLTNLQQVNDDNEANRIGAKEYENTFYVASFTYDPDIDENHWKEYGTIEDGVLVAVKNGWFNKKAFFFSKDGHIEDDFFKIYPSYDIAMKKKIEEQGNGRIINPFYIAAFGFYQVIYDDNLVKSIFSDSTMSMDDMELRGKSVIPEVAGIVKNKTGICNRYGCVSYTKDWESEKEVRLKLRLHQLNHVRNGNELHDGMIMPVALRNIAVPLSKDAFEELRIRFSPRFRNRNEYIKKIESLYGIKVIEF